MVQHQRSKKIAEIIIHRYFIQMHATDLENATWICVAIMAPEENPLTAMVEELITRLLRTASGPPAPPP